MKALKKIGKWLLILIIILVVVSFFLPSGSHVERSAVIKADPAVVFAQINTLKNWEKWSPWHKIDTAMKLTYAGPESGTGASYSWASENSKVGNGKLTIMNSVPNDSIITQLEFEGMGASSGRYRFTKTDSGTKVTWAMDSKCSSLPWYWRIPAKYMGLFMDKMIGPDFEKGLASLKTLAESTPAGPKTYRGYAITEETSPEKVYIGKKDSIGWDKIGDFYKTNLVKISEAAAKAGMQMAGAPCGLFWKWDVANKMTVMSAAMPVQGKSDAKIKGYQTFVVPAGKILHIAYYGPYEETEQAHLAMGDYIKEKGFTQLSPVVEEYVTDPGKEPNPSKWLTNIYYFVK